MTAFATDRLHIAPFVPEDFDGLERLLYSDAAVRRCWSRVQRFEPWSGSMLYAVQTPVGERIRQGEVDSEGCGSWTLRRRADGQLLGQLVLGPPERVYWLVFASDPEASRIPFEVDLHCALGAAFRGQGYAEEACRAVIRYALEELRLRRLVTHIAADNTPALALAQRLGWRLEENRHPQYGGYIAVRDNDLL